jgi:hypothetical protein
MSPSVLYPPYPNPTFASSPTGVSYKPTIWPRSLRSKATVAETVPGALIMVQTPLSHTEPLSLSLRHRR